MVKQAVGQIRELSKATRSQIREMNNKIAEHMFWSMPTIRSWRTKKLLPPQNSKISGARCRGP